MTTEWGLKRPGRSIHTRTHTGSTECRIQSDEGEILCNGKLMDTEQTVFKVDGAQWYSGCRLNKYSRSAKYRTTYNYRSMELQNYMTRKYLNYKIY